MPTAPIRRTYSIQDVVALSSLPPKEARKKLIPLGAVNQTFDYTAESVAQITGLTIQTVYSHSSRKVVDIRSLKSVVIYIADRSVPAIRSQVMEGFAFGRDQNRKYHCGSLIDITLFVAAWGAEPLRKELSGKLIERREGRKGRKQR